MSKEFDAFVCHTSEDKDEVVRPLAMMLVDLGLNIWYDEFTLEVGDSLIESIDHGLVNSRFGIVILSSSFLNKGWPKYELRGLLTREIGGKKTVLPVWHNITLDELKSISPPLADKYALNTSDHSLDEIALMLVRVIRPGIFENLVRYAEWQRIKGEGKAKYTPLRELKPGPIRHEDFPQGFLIRMKLVYRILEEVIGFPMDRLIRTLQRDLHPEEELAIWERIAAAYSDLTRSRKLKRDEKREIFANLLSISMQTKEKLIEFSKDGDESFLSLISHYVDASPSVPPVHIPDDELGA
jgi:hypothetical protein